MTVPSRAWADACTVLVYADVCGSFFRRVSIWLPEAERELSGVEARWLDVLAEAEKQEFD